jgi:hypothetical protein
MDAAATLIKILAASTATDLFTRGDYKKEYLKYLKTVHPDVCAHPLATKAAQRLLDFKKKMESFEIMEDDAGKFTQTDAQTFVFQGDTDFLKQSLNNYQRLMRLNDAASNHFKKYLPASMSLENDVLMVKSREKAVAFSGLTLEQHHVTWIASRMFELTAWLHQVGFTHLGFNPESLAVLPENHGIILLSFYHLTPLNQKIQTISGRYLNWYPPVTLDQKRALPYIDLCLAQRTAIYLLGDASGNGVKLKKTHSERLIDFWIAPHEDAFQTFDDYRKLLYELFGKPKFFVLNI